MSTWQWLLLALAVTATLYTVFVASLIIAGRGGDAAALARFIPDCVVFFRRLVADPRLPRGRKLLLLALVAYLVIPFDLVPDFIPIIGQLDDAILIALVLTVVLRASGPALVTKHWPGPEQSLGVILRLAGPTPPSPTAQRH